MLVFEPQNPGVGSDRSPNWAATSAIGKVELRIYSFQWNRPNRRTDENRRHRIGPIFRKNRSHFRSSSGRSWTRDRAPPWSSRSRKPEPEMENFRDRIILRCSCASPATTSRRWTGFKFLRKLFLFPENFWSTGSQKIEVAGIKPVTSKILANHARH